MVALMVVTKPALAIATVSRMQGDARLSRQESRVLEYLATHEGRYVSGSELLDALWGGYGADSTPRVYVSRIRAKLGADVIDVWEKHGYRLARRTVDQLTWRCGRCGRSLAEYGDEWVCYGCGASGTRPRDPEGPPSRWLTCWWCSAEFERALSDQEYEQARRPGARVFCTRSCAAKAKWDDRRRQQREGGRR